jgi:hypothetical protein
MVWLQAERLEDDARIELSTAHAQAGARARRREILLGERLLRKYGRDKQGYNQKIHQEAGEGRPNMLGLLGSAPWK